MPPECPALSVVRFRFYLKEWTSRKDDYIYCLRDDQIFLTNLRNVGAENHFYRLHELSLQDVALIRELAIDQSPDHLKPIHEKLVRTFSLPHLVKKRLEDSGKPNAELLARVDRSIAELNENLHTSIEEQFKPYLESMRGGDTTFYSDPANSARFFGGIAAQYLRTNVLKRSLEFFGPDKMPTFRRIMNVIVHIYAINLGHNLYLDQERYTIALLENISEVPFITGDQPIINLAAQVKGKDPPEQLELYYPVSPTRAMLLLKSSSKHFPSTSSVTAISAHIYNLYMGAHSHQQLFAGSEKELGSVRDDLPGFLSCLI